MAATLLSLQEREVREKVAGQDRKMDQGTSFRMPYVWKLPSPGNGIYLSDGMSERPSKRPVWRINFRELLC